MNRSVQGPGVKFVPRVHTLTATRAERLAMTARKVLAERPQADAISAVSAAVYWFMESKELRGACHALSAIGHVLLSEHGVENELCLGEVALVRPSGEIAAWGHSWLEIGGSVVDIAIKRPLNPVPFPLAPVVGGVDLDTERPTSLIHGVDTKSPVDTFVDQVRSCTVGDFATGFNQNMNFEFWRVIVDLGADTGLALSGPALIAKHAGTRWRFTSDRSLPLAPSGLVDGIVRTPAGVERFWIRFRVDQADANWIVTGTPIPIDANAEAGHLLVVPDLGTEVRVLEATKPAPGRLRLVVDGDPTNPADARH
jgi:Transglutaminase-like superfamily